MKIAIVERLDDIPPEQWNRLAPARNPFLRHEFLNALEHHGCVGDTFGWLPHHIAVFDDNRQLVGACPLYFKDNSYGEFVFDWAWADAYERTGKRYYPKAVSSIPYTPVTGPRLLIAPEADRETVSQALMQTALELTQAQGLSSLHWLFPDSMDTACLKQAGFMLRLGCQFHWTNPGYRDFDDFLSTFSSKKRKNLKRERRLVQEAGFTFRIVHGHEASARDLELAQFFYQSTFDKKWGTATLNLAFFQEIAERMGEQLVLIFADHNHDTVAGAICFRGSDALYGRHWGCFNEYDNLHFETCYYQGIDYAIQHGLNLFEPGAQGEHKISRGFQPTPTWSAHWIADDGFRTAVQDFLNREARAMRDYIETLHEHSPYRDDALPPAADH